MNMRHTYMRDVAKIFSPIALILAPLFAFAQTTQANLSTVAALIVKYLNLALYMLMAVAVLMFVFYIIKYFIMPSEKGREEGGKYLLWSLIGFFVIVSLWGLVNILVNTFNVGQTNSTSWASLSNLFPK